jgi:hypothetical protein
MKFLLYLILLGIPFFSYGQTIIKTDEVEYYDINQEQFTFLVFDKSKVDTFMSKFETLVFRNPTIKDELMKLTALKYNSTKRANFSSFNKNTKASDTSDFNLATNVIKTTYDNNGEKYFHGSLSYLFFYNCLPDCFQDKWTQTTLGDFRFNTTFFSLLRDKSEIIDNMIYGRIGYWDIKLKTIFGEHIFNEITQDKAKQIKDLIETDKSFNDIRFKQDRDNFIFFLDKTIKNEWRLILTDWN